MTITIVRPPRWWRFKRFMGFDSARRAGVLYIPEELSFPDAEPGDTILLTTLIEQYLREPLNPSRWYRWRRFWGCDSVRDERCRRTMVPLILRGPADARIVL